MGRSRSASLLFGYCIPRKLLAKLVAKKEREEEQDDEKKESDTAAVVASAKQLVDLETSTVRSCPQQLPAAVQHDEGVVESVSSQKRQRDSELDSEQQANKAQRKEEDESLDDSDVEDVGDIDGALAYCGYEDLDGQDSSDISIPEYMGRDDKKVIWVYLSGLDFHTADKCNTTLEIKPKELLPSKEQIVMLKKFAAEVGLRAGKKPRWFLRATGY